MKQEKCYLYLGWSAKPTKLAKNHEMILLNSGFEKYADEPDKIPKKLFGYMTTFVIKCNSPKSIIEEIKMVWKNESGATISLKLITDNIEFFSNDQLKALKKLNEDEWSYRLPLCIYRLRSCSSYSSAKEFILETALRN